MYEYYFTFQSLTTAQKTLAELLAKGIGAELVRSPKRIASYGCGYAVTVSAADGYTASVVIRSAGIYPAKTIRFYYDGRSELVGV